MVRKLFVVSVALALIVAALSPALAQEKKIGVGMDLENQRFDVFFNDVDNPFFTFTYSTLTPTFLLSWRVNPNVFVEPAVGVYWGSQEQKNTSVSPSQTDKLSFRDVKLGIGVLYLTNPSAFLSPFFRGKFDVHLMKVTDEEDVVGGTDKEELSGTAFVIIGGLGGIMTINESVFVSLEGRLLYGFVGDTDDKRSGPSYPAWQDQEDTKGSALTTDMVVSLRVLFW